MPMWRVYRAIFLWMCWVYWVVPLVAASWWSYHNSNAWLLLGALASYIASNPAGTKLMLLSTLVMIGYWLNGGFSIYQWPTYLWAFVVFGSLAYAIADSYEEEFKKELHRFVTGNDSDDTSP